MSWKLIDKILEDVKVLGICNIFVFRGDLLRRVEYCDSNELKIDDDEEEEFYWVVDFVCYICKIYGDYFCIGVVVYLEGYVDESYFFGQSLEYDFFYFVEKVQVGVDFFMIQLFFDIVVYDYFEKIFWEYLSGVFKDIVIIFGFMFIQSY